MKITRDKIVAIEKFFLWEYPEIKTDLVNWTNDYQLLVAIALSAQTTDKQVNIVTEKLFSHIVTPNDMQKIEQSYLNRLIRTVNFHNSKAVHLKQMADQLVKHYNSTVPRNIESLITLSGIGYKSANVFLNIVDGANAGFAVDTHVKRVANRLGITNNVDPNKVSKDLEKKFSKDSWSRLSAGIVLFGRYRCKAREVILLKRLKVYCTFREI